MTRIEAEIIRDKAAANDDAEDWIAVHEEILWPRFVQSLETEWSSLPRLVAKHRSISKAMELLRQNRYIADTEKIEFWGRALSSITRDYGPRITQAAIDEMAEIMKRTYPEAFVTPHVIGESLNRRLSEFLERQGRLGEADDQLWLGYLDMFSLEHFERWLRLQSSGSYLLQQVSIRKSLDRQYDRHPDDPWLTRLAGVIRSRDGKFAEAEPLLAKSADLFADDPEGRHAWAEARLALKLQVDVESIMGPPSRKSIHFETQEAMRLMYRAQLYEKQGQFEAARHDAEAAVALDPRSVKGWETLARLAKNSGDTERWRFAESQARIWTDKETRLITARQAFAKRFAETRSQDRRMRDDAGTVEPLVNALRDLDWPGPAEALKLARKLALGEVVHSGFRKLPEIQPGVPDRFFQPRPVLRSEKPESRGLGGVRL